MPEPALSSVVMANCTRCTRMGVGETDELLDAGWTPHVASDHLGWTCPTCCGCDELTTSTNQSPALRAHG